MAKNKNNKDENVLTAKQKNLLAKHKKNIELIDSKTTFLVHGADQSFVNRNKEDFRKIKDTINLVSDKYKTVTGDSMIEFFTKMAMDEKRSNQKSKNNNSTEKGLLDLSKVLENPNNGVVTELFMREKHRFTLMDDYDLIVKYIPQLAQALEVLVDNIISPDDFTKDIFSLYYNNADVKISKNGTEIIKKLRKLEDQYHIEDKTKKIVRDTLKYGDQFIGILPFNREFNKLFAESTSILNEDKGLILNEDNFIMNEQEEETLKNILTKSDQDYNIENLKEDIMDMINNNISFTNNPMAILRDELIMENDFNITSVDTRGKFENVSLNDLDDSPNKKKKKSKNKLLFSNDNVLLNNIDSDKKAKSDNTYIEGSYVKMLDPRRVIKIYLNETCYGYYYIETDMANLQFTNNALANTNTFQVRNAVDINYNDQGLQQVDPKTKLIVDVFLKNISKKLDKKFIQNNKEFKNVLYNLIKEDYIIKKKVNIIYLNPEDVEHICINQNSNTGYGASVFEKILFTAKLYLAVLTSTLMMKISRSADHRTFYIETGLGNDIEGTIQSFVREIKGKEIKISDLTSIDTILNNVGMFHDYYIPQIDGQKSIDIDTIPGQQTEMENDFLEYLKKTMISGMGIPASFLSYSDEMEFARSVSQMNGMFLRTIVGYQKTIGNGFSGIYRKLYKHEYEYADSKNSDVEMIDYSLIEARFPSPATLNMTNLADQIGTVQSVRDFIIETLVGNSETDEKKRDKLSKQVTKQLIPNIDWEEYENILKETPIEEVEEKLLNGEGSGGESGDMMNDDY